MGMDSQMQATSPQAAQLGALHVMWVNKLISEHTVCAEAFDAKHMANA